MKTTNYLYLEFRRALKKFQKLQTRFDKRIASGTLDELTAKKKYYLIRKIRKLRDKIGALSNRLKLAGVAGIVGLSLMATDADAQVAVPKTATFDRHLLNEAPYLGNQRDPSVAMNNDGDIITVWKDGYYLRGKKIDTDGTEHPFQVFQGDEILVADSPEIAINEDGDFAVVWQFDNNNDLSIQVERFDGETLVGEGASLVDDLDDDLLKTDQKLDIALESDGDILLTYVDVNDTDPNHEIKLAYIENGQAPSVQILNSANIAAFDAANPSLVMDDDGNSIVLWDEDQYLSMIYGNAHSVFYQKFEAGAIPLVAPDDVPQVLVSGEAEGSGTVHSVNADAALLENGEFVVTWVDDDGFSGIIRAQKFDANGIGQGSELFVDGYSDGESYPKIAVDGNGGFAVTYDHPNYFSPLVSTSRYDASGNSLDNINSFNPSTGHTISEVSFDMNDKGDFVIVWSDNHDDNEGDGTDQDGAASYLSKYEDIKEPVLVLGQSPIAPGSSDDQQNAKIASDIDGNYVVVWSEEGVVNNTIKGQKFTSEGKKEGIAFDVFDNLTDGINALDIDMNDAGQFVVAWADDNGIYKKYFDASGASDPGKIDVYSDFHLAPVSVALNDDGDFSVVSWAYNSDDNRIYANFSDDGLLDPLDFIVVNDSSSFVNVGAPDVAIGLDENFVVAWHDAYLDLGGAYNSVHSRRYIATVAQEIESIAISDGSNGGYEFPQVSSNHETGDFGVVWTDGVGGEMSAATFEPDGTEKLGQFNVPDFNFISSSLFDPQIDMRSDGDFSILWHGTEDGGANPGAYIKKYTETGDVIATDKYTLSQNHSSIGVAIGEDRTIVVGANQNSISEVVQSIIVDPAHFEFSNTYESIVNTITIGNQLNAKIAANTDGDYVVVWEDDDFYNSIKAQIFTSDDEKVGDEIIINTPNSDAVYNPNIALDDEGNFLVTWLDVESNLMAQFMNISDPLTPILDDFPVSSELVGTDTYDIAIDSDGNFTVVWSENDYTGDYSYSDVFSRKFNSVDGIALDVDADLFQTVSPTSNETVSNLDIAFNSDGDMAIAYDIYFSGNDGSGDVMYIRSLSLAGVLTSPVALENVFCVEGCSTELAMVSDNSGDFVIANFDFVSYAEGNSITMYRYVSSTNSVSSPQCATIGTSLGGHLSLTNADDGDFVLAYELEDGNYSIFTQRVSNDFEPIGTPYKLNETPTQNFFPEIISPSNGKFVTTWTSNSLDGSGEAVAIKNFSSYKPILSESFAVSATVDEGSSNNLGLNPALVTNLILPEQPGSFSITSLPTHGTISVSGWQVSIGEIVPLEDIDLVVYNHDGSETLSDSFEFVISNGIFETPVTFDIVINPINDVPTLVDNTSLNVDEGDNGHIGTLISMEDVDNSTGQQFFEVATELTSGQLRNTSTNVVYDLGMSFTQADLNSNFIVYEHDGSEGSNDSFDFTLKDLTDIGETYTFSISINPINDEPTVATNVALSVDEADVIMISNLNMQVLDPDDEADQLLFTLTSIPDYGVLRRDGIELENADTFTQQDIDDDLLSYEQNGTEDSTTDDFGFDIEDASGAGVDGLSFDFNIGFLNDTPLLVGTVGDQAATEDEAFSFDLPTGLFSDEESTTLTLTATLNDDSPLPTWLSFDGTTFSGTPLEGDTDITVKVIGTDEGGLSATTSFNLTITPVNGGPVVNTESSIADQIATEDEAFSFVIPADAFSDEENTPLTLTASQSDDSALPAWLSFAVDTFTGTPAEGDGDVVVKVTASDGRLSVSDEFLITVVGVNDAPVVDQGIADQTVTGYGSFTFAVPSDAFSDVDDEVLVLSATMDDNSDLPTFLSFDPSTGEFSGQALINIDEGTYQIKVTAEDSQALTVSTPFELEIVSVLAIGDLEVENSVSLYPNPTSTNLNVRIDNQIFGQYHVELIDRSGRVIISDKFDKEGAIYQYMVNVSGLEQGLYVLRMINENTTTTYKINKF